MNQETMNLIARLEGMSKQGKSYDILGHHGWQNPIKSDTGWLLHGLTLAEKPKSVLEIGTAYGLSGTYIASALPENGLMVTIDFDKEVAKEAQNNFDSAHLPVKVMSGDALKVIDDLVADPFNMVFLDANKSGYFAQVMSLQNKGLLAPGCLIVADNVIDRESEMPDFLAYMKGYNSIIFKTQAGLLIGRI